MLLDPNGDSAEGGGKPDRARWGVLALLFLSIAVNLLDRQVLSVLAPVIRDELRLSNSEYSYILFSFLLGLTLAQVPAGILIDRKGPRFGIPIIMLWWSAANGLHSLARSVADFCGLRFLLGVGECGNYSAGVKVISNWFPPRERALAGGLFNSGTVIGALAAPWLIVKLSSHFGWRMAFVVPSVLGVLWIVPWLLFFTCQQIGALADSIAEHLSFEFVPPSANKDKEKDDHQDAEDGGK